MFSRRPTRLHLIDYCSSTLAWFTSCVDLVHVLETCQRERETTDAQVLARENNSVHRLTHLGKAIILSVNRFMKSKSIFECRQDRIGQEIRSSRSSSPILLIQIERIPSRIYIRCRRRRRVSIDSFFGRNNAVGFFEINR